MVKQVETHWLVLAFVALRVVAMDAEPTSVAFEAGHRRHAEADSQNISNPTAGLSSRDTQARLISARANARLYPDVPRE